MTNTNDLDDQHGKYSVFTIESLQLVIQRSAIISIETILDLEPVDFNFDTDCVSTITTATQSIPIFSVNQNLDSIGNFPLQRRACLIMKSDNNQAFGISVDTISALNEADINIHELPEYMLTNESIIKSAVEVNNKIMGVIDNLHLARALNVDEFYAKQLESITHEAILSHA